MKNTNLITDAEVRGATSSPPRDGPGELRYRLIGRHLVLFDTHAGLVVDFLRDARPAH